MTETLTLATRGSELALRQAETVRDALSTRKREVEIRRVETRGDQIPDELIHRLGRTGAFVRALDEEVLAGDADLAVHSMKDVPTEGMDDMVVAGVPERAAAGDVLVHPDGRALADLPSGAVVGTGSLRRTAQVLAARPDLVVEPIRGNVDTRLEKLLAPGLQAEHECRLAAAGEEAALTAEEGTDEDEEFGDPAEEFDESVEEWFDSLSDLERSAMERKVDDEYDALVLAEAGLRRSNLLGAAGTTRLSREEFVPAAGQGAIAVTVADDAVAEAVRSAVDHPRTRVATTVERTVLAELNGGCIAPIGVSALVQGEHVHTRVRVLSTDGTEEVEGTRDLPIRSHATAAASFAADLADRGAAELIAEARAEVDADA
ncbi:hydroxymethylbilane synthase [Halorubrum halodurans]|uniref:Hydroxymethylbilane synthase n=1 Tax=Halorubrum halodurans TaxID=1383851 RepID=A0A256ISK6_9EURY|nr:hydroxymethylbilane synthase [Halorubrum halodurans]OYR59550.1 hydroxymethylbilane synthase [Halorubrum halodurans]